MKFQLNQTVILLDTQYKPAGNAIIRNHDEESKHFEVDYKYPDSEKVEQIWVPVERLIISKEIDYNKIIATPL